MSNASPGRLAIKLAIALTKAPRLWPPDWMRNENPPERQEKCLSSKRALPTTCFCLVASYKCIKMEHLEENAHSAECNRGKVQALYWILLSWTFQNFRKCHINWAIPIKSSSVLMLRAKEMKKPRDHDTLLAVEVMLTGKNGSGIFWCRFNSRIPGPQSRKTEEISDNADGICDKNSSLDLWATTSPRRRCRVDLAN